MTGSSSTIRIALRDLAKKSPLAVRVAGTCMAPALVAGETVFVQANGICLPGDLVVFEGRQGGYVIHRAIGYGLSNGRLALLTQADAFGRADAPVPLSAVLGRAPAESPWARVKAGFRYLRYLRFLVGYTRRKCADVVR